MLKSLVMAVRAPFFTATIVPVVIGAVLGWRVLGEPFGVLRILASLVVAIGLVVLVWAMHGGA